MKEAVSSKLALFGSAITFILSLLLLGQFQNQSTALQVQYSWIPELSAHLTFGLKTGYAMLMVLLTTLSFLLIFLLQQSKQKEGSSLFYGLMLLAQAGLLGVFLSQDALLFYIFWELALIPVYFLCSMYGGEKRIAVTYKFFVYTFTGSLFLLIALLYIHSHTHSFSMEEIIRYGATVPKNTQYGLFWLMFIAFAIKMPIFPFHTWQPDTYQQSSTPVTIVLSALMVKMGLFAVLTWLVPVFPIGVKHWSNWVMLLSVVGIVYASMLAMVQTNIKRLLAYSSIAHIGLMSAAIFSGTTLGTQGVAIQMFTHGINIMAMWFLVEMAESRFQTQDLNQMGGIAKVAPLFTISLVIVSLANIALPLTNGFVGEFIMFNGLFTSTSPYAFWFTLAAGLGVILSAVYTLNMIQKVAYGSMAEGTSFKDLSLTESLVMALLILIILVFGFYPQPILHLANLG